MRVNAGSGFGPLVREARTSADDDVSHLTAVLRAARHLPIGARHLDVRVAPRMLAFSRRDTHRAEFAAATEVAREHGFEPVVRHVGGAFAPLHGGSLVIDQYGTSADASTTSMTRFVEHSGILQDALRALGLDARVGELPGEYCPGEFSVNVGGRVKVAGVAQRVSGPAWVVSTVLQVAGVAELRPVTVDVARVLGEHVDPATMGDLASAGVGLSLVEVRAHIAAAFATRRT